MNVALLVALFVVAGGFVAARALRWRRHERRMEERLEVRDELRRRHHYRGSLDLELEKGPPVRDRSAAEEEAD